MTDTIQAAERLAEDLYVARSKALGFHEPYDFARLDVAQKQAYLESAFRALGLLMDAKTSTDLFALATHLARATWGPKVRGYISPSEPWGARTTH